MNMIVMAIADKKFKKDSFALINFLIVLHNTHIVVVVLAAVGRAVAGPHVVKGDGHELHKMPILKVTTA
jgi:hypothetical protein